MDDLWGNAWSDPASASESQASESVAAGGAVKRLVDSPTWSAADDLATLPTLPANTTSARLDAVPSSPSWALPQSTAFESGWGTEDLRADIARHSSWGATGLASDAWDVDSDDGEGEKTAYQQEESPYPSTVVEDGDESNITGISQTDTQPAPDSSGRATPFNTTANDFQMTTIDLNPVDTTTDASTLFKIASPSLVTSRVATPGTPSLPASPDGFGTFESASGFDASVGVQSWSPPKATLSFALPAHPGGEESWGESGWGTNSLGAEEAEPGDAWGGAQQVHKENERRVSPHMVDTLLAQWAEFSVDVLAAPKDEPAASEYDDLDSGARELTKMNIRLDDFAPFMSLPQSIPYVDSIIGKHQQNALKISKHLPATRASPLSHLFASKTSLAWENSVRSRVDPVVDDWAWMGGKPPEPAEEPKPVAPAPRKSGIFSFFGRRTSVANIDTPVIPAASPSNAVKSPGPQPSASASAPPISSPRPPSLEGPRKDPITTNGFSMVESIHSPPATSSVIPAPPSKDLVETPPTFDPTPVIFSDIDEPAEPAPSAVSRFLGRFTRARDSRSSLGGHQIALSSSDLTFLDDIPSHIDGDDEDELKALEGLLRGKAPSQPPQPSKLPMPLAPPPKSSQQRAPTAFKAPPPPNARNVTTNANHDDLWSIFDSPPPPTTKGKGQTTPFPSLSHHSSHASLPALPKPQSNMPILSPPPRSGTPSSIRSGTLTNPPSRSSTPKLPPPPSSGLRQTPGQGSRSSSPMRTGNTLHLKTTSSPGFGSVPPRIPLRQLTKSSVSSSLLSTPPPPAVAASNDFDDFNDFVDASPGTPSFPTIATPVSSTSSPFRARGVSPIITNPTPISSATRLSFFGDEVVVPVQGKGSVHQEDDDNFGDFLSLGHTVQNVDRPHSPLPSPRLSAPPTPLNSEKPLSKPRRQDTLISKASQRTGRWPAPPSPLPQLLPGPPLLPKPGASHIGGLDDLLGGSPEKQSVEMQREYPFPALLSGAQETITTVPPLNGALLLGAMPLTVDSSVPSLANSSAVLNSDATPPPNTYNPTFSLLSGDAGSNKKLSAQDLSFFEGL